MYLIVGLGNPGKKYEKTRHNVGFRIIDAIKGRCDFYGWQTRKECSAILSDGKISQEKIILCKPQIFMNNSGDAVKCLIKILGLDAEKLIVVHDDTDLPLGKIKIVKNRGSAGHQGVNSVIKALGAKDFVRFRIGTGTKNIKKTKDFVLQKFSRAEERILKKVTATAIRATELAFKEGITRAMTEYNK